MSTTSPISPPPTLRLWVMMFLQFAIWGAWLPLVFGYLGSESFSHTIVTDEGQSAQQPGFSANQQTIILIAFPVAAIIAMFFSNQFADRNFAAEKFLAFSHAVGGAAMLGLGFVTDFWPFAILMWIHCLVYVPTISITNSIAFNAMKDAQKEFGIVRMGGTVGWIAVAWPLFFLLSGDPDAARWTYVLAGIVSFVLAVYSFTLPHTPPNKTGERLAWLRALKSLAIPFVLVLWLVTMIDATVHDLYFMWTGGFLQSIGIEQKWVMPIMSIGQIAEIGTMIVLGYFLTRLGWKKTMIIGVLGHAVRFAVFAFVPIPSVVIIANLLHGICYAFFFATVYIFVDEYLPKDVRSSTQGLFNLMILGMGPIISRIVAPPLFEWYQSTTTVDGVESQVVDYQSLFLYPCIAALVAAALLAFCFWPPANDRKKVEPTEAPIDELPAGTPA